MILKATKTQNFINLFFTPFLAIIFIFSLKLNAQLTMGNNFPQTQLNDQHDKPQAITQETPWVLFSADMDAFKMAQKILEENKNISFSTQKGLLVSDISKMPSLIAKIFALPKMRKYHFSMALDREGKITSTWPKQEKSLTVIYLNQLNITKIDFLKTPEQVSEFFKNSAQNQAPKKADADTNANANNNTSPSTTK